MFAEWVNNIGVPSKMQLWSVVDSPSLLYRYYNDVSTLSRFLRCPEGIVNDLISEFKLKPEFPKNFRKWKHREFHKSSLLYVISRILKPQTVVETGVAAGTSSFGILSALCDNHYGHLYSIDLPEAIYNMDNGRLTDSPMGSKPTGWLVPSPFPLP